MSLSQTLQSINSVLTCMLIQELWLHAVAAGLQQHARAMGRSLTAGPLLPVTVTHPSNTFLGIGLFFVGVPGSNESKVCPQKSAAHCLMLGVCCDVFQGSWVFQSSPICWINPAVTLWKNIKTCEPCPRASACFL